MLKIFLHAPFMFIGRLVFCIMHLYSRIYNFWIFTKIYILVQISESVSRCVQNISVSTRLILWWQNILGVMIQIRVVTGWEISTNNVGCVTSLILATRIGGVTVSNVFWILPHCLGKVTSFHKNCLILPVEATREGVVLYFFIPEGLENQSNYLPSQLWQFSSICINSKWNFLVYTSRLKPRMQR